MRQTSDNLQSRFRLVRHRGWKARYQQVGTGMYTGWVAYPGHDNDINGASVVVQSWTAGARKFGKGLQQMGEKAREMIQPMSEFAKAFNDHPASIHAQRGTTAPDADGVVTLHSLPAGIALLEKDDEHPDFDSELPEVPMFDNEIVRFSELTVPQLREHARDYSQSMSVPLPKGFAKFRRAKMIEWMTDNMEVQ